MFFYNKLISFRCDPKNDFSFFLKQFETPRKPYKTLNFLVFDHIGGLNTLLNILSIGATMIMENKSGGFMNLDIVVTVGLDIGVQSIPVPNMRVNRNCWILKDQAISFLPILE